MEHQTLFYYRNILLFKALMNLTFFPGLGSEPEAVFLVVCDHSMNEL